MCGRYSFFTEAPSREVLEILDKLRQDPQYGRMKTGEIFPSNLAPVLVPEGEVVVPRLFSWGFPSFRGKGLIINARSETIHEKRLFRGPMERERCVIPSTGFYEWDEEKHKFLFTLPDTPMLYMAGVHHLYEGGERFVILTTGANGSVADVHDRMPVILREGDVEGWLYDPGAADAILQDMQPALARRAS